MKSSPQAIEQINFKQKIELLIPYVKKRVIAQIKAVSLIIIYLIYGVEYSQSNNILRIFSILILILPLTSLYSSFLVSQNKPRKVAKYLLLSVILNIILNLTFILYLVPYGAMAAVYGAVIATIISKIIYLGLLIKK